MKKIVNYKVSGEEWTKAKDEAFAKIVKKAKVDGFRQGKVPRSVFEKKYGTGDIISEAMEKIVDAKYGETVVKEKLIPVVEPKLEIEKANDDELEFKITFILDPEVKLGEYKGLKVKKEKVKVTKEEVEHEVGHILDRYAELVSKDGAVEEGDTAIIDFKGFKDNEAFDGGSAEGYTLEIGSHSFIPGFEEGVVGMKKEENKDIELSFPEDYMAKDLAGQKVVFNVTVHDIKKRVIPELDEEFFKDLEYNDVKTKEELENKVKEELQKEEQAKLDDIHLDKVLDKAMENMKIELNEEIVDDEIHRMIHEYERQLKMQGLDMNKYFELTGDTEEGLHKKMEGEATKRVKCRYLIEEVAKKENIDFTKEEVDAKAKEMAENYGITVDELIKAYGTIDVVKYDMAMHKALEIIKENN